MFLVSLKYHIFVVVPSHELSSSTCDRGTGPCARANHVAALYDDKTLLIFGGSSKSKTLDDLYSLDFDSVCQN